jgi:hypothetical protein
VLFRSASFPAHAIAAGKQSVILAEKEVPQDLLAEGNAFSATLGGPGAREAMEKFLRDGGQTRDVELNLGSLFD